MSNLYIGIMSGTSLDAVDAVLMDFSDSAKLVEAIEIALPLDLREEIHSLNSPSDNEMQRSLILDKKLAYLFSSAVNQLMIKAGRLPEEISAIGCHGQTLRHAPDGLYGYSHQIGSGNLIAELTRICVVNDFRGRDIAAGGQGAPLVPAFHDAVFRDDSETRAIVNIGGMANVSLLHRDGTTLGFDTGPGNVLMDYWCQHHHQQRFDLDGNWARSGTVDNALLDRLLSDAFFSKAPPKSTGREEFDAHWLEQQLKAVQFNHEDIQATLLELTARSICESLPEIDAIYLCGGGAYNGHLKQRIEALSRKPVTDTSALGIAAEYVEAAAFAWLACQTIRQLPGNCASATGAKGPRILGAIYSA